MNALTDVFPEAVELHGIPYELDTDFRTGIEIMLLFEDDTLTQYEKMALMVRMLYKETPEDLEGACQLAVKFLNCGEEETAGGGGGGGQRLYSFQHDGKYIYSSILQSHGIDLNSVAYMHWWKFCFLFMDLREDCMFNRVVQLRRKKQEGRLDKEEMKLWAKMPEVFQLPQAVSSEEKLAEEIFMGLLSGQ